MPALFYSTLDLLLGKLDPVSRFLVFADKYRSRLQSIKFVKISFVRHVAHKMIDITFLLLFLFVFLKNKRLGSTKTIMQLTDRLRIAEY
jgi:hypothetical protein